MVRLDRASPVHHGYRLNGHEGALLFHKLYPKKLWFPRYNVLILHITVKYSFRLQTCILQQTNVVQIKKGEGVRCRITKDIIQGFNSESIKM